MLTWLHDLWMWFNANRLRQIVSAATAVVVVAALIVAVCVTVSRSRMCAPGVRHVGDECVGVSPGSYVFAPPLAEVEKVISRENDAVAKKPHVTIALLMPLTDANPNAQAEILHAVQGAYVAQYRANHEQNDEGPPIRLVLANPGVNSAHWGDVVDRLHDMTDGPDNLRAVVGIAVSTTNTKNEVYALTHRGIPVVGGAISADDITNSPGRDDRYPGLSRVSPTNDEVAPALTRFGGVDTKEALLVEDARTDDNYISTLAAAFGRHLTGSPQQPELYTSPKDIDQEGDTPRQFRQMVPNICQSGVKWIYFAGRQVQLRVFINALEKRGCQDRKFTILTGTVASHLGNDPKLSAGAFATGITLDYAAIAHPGAWSGPHVPATGGSRQGYEAFASTLNDAATRSIGPTGTTDGQAIITHDAVWTAVAQVRDATSEGSPIPSIGAVANERRSLHDVHKVIGASGWICLDNGGNPYDKAVPIVQYQTNGTPRFITLAWPTGAPPAETCTAPFIR
ncbi:hypothetical protein [Actinoallomurus iriomotensis]|uniref:Leucine-binding protein domain-containing protein n=1 Tax=Actinoallomurus iriomotensis TaxID=478107 RepID=A0A9W6RX11_9ACTN|nr:hypothetical protein [Actinoallomurus iriomotensis]GLY83223.1 hypothetical protein Airi02_011530 [Actinoallomurus iriomotensis]